MTDGHATYIRNNLDHLSRVWKQTCGGIMPEAAEYVDGELDIGCSGRFSRGVCVRDLNVRQLAAYRRCDAILYRLTLYNPTLYPKSS